MGYPPSLFWEASEAKNGPKRIFFWKNHCAETLQKKCFCFMWLVAMENVIFEFVGIMLCCQSVANSGGLATLAFLVVAKTS